MEHLWSLESARPKVFVFFKYLLIWLCWVLVAAREIFSLCRGMSDLLLHVGFNSLTRD